MSEFAERISKIIYRYQQKCDTVSKLNLLRDKFKDSSDEYEVYLEAQELLSSVSDEATSSTLDYITGIVNKALEKLFPADVRKISMERSLVNGQHASIKVKLEDGDGHVRDLQLQCGTGVRQVISFLFTVSLITLRGGRPILIMDEILSGLHPRAKATIDEVIHIFAEGGFQFVMVEYGMHLGKVYVVGHEGKDALLESEFDAYKSFIDKMGADVSDGVHQAAQYFGVSDTDIQTALSIAG